PSSVFGLYIVSVFKSDLPIPWFLRPEITSSWVSVLLLFSFLILFSGVASFFDPDFSSRLSLKDSLLRLILQRMNKEEAVEEPIFDEEYEEYNPVDYVHVHKINIEEPDEV
ncbi:MAG: hypothetical protein NWE89_02995, partial [Candidatus Bathyarchaeota archaeon]|nr:hypothetical protein [Candidatus Bathyarchaeota archaeon]